jgi:hypothetical protein
MRGIAGRRSLLYIGRVLLRDKDTSVDWTNAASATLGPIQFGVVSMMRYIGGGSHQACGAKPDGTLMLPAREATDA